MGKEWVDFKAIKALVGMEMVLNHYGIKGLSQNGDELRGPCPIHKGPSRSKNFTVNMHKNAFKCFSQKCSAKGNVLDFVAAMEGCNVREAAVKLADWFKVGESQLQSPKQGKDIAKRSDVQRGIYKNREGELYEVITNALSAEDHVPLVVYRELFGDYKFLVSSSKNFGQADSQLTLVKTL